MFRLFNERVDKWWFPTLSAGLVVDDEVEVCKSNKKFLEAKGYDIIVSYSGEDALKKLKNEKPDIILLDIKMPGMDGMEVLSVQESLTIM